jgi:hypothetical protein
LPSTEDSSHQIRWSLSKSYRFVVYLLRLSNIIQFDVDGDEIPLLVSSAWVECFTVVVRYISVTSSAYDAEDMEDAYSEYESLDEADDEQRYDADYEPE